MKHTLKLVRQFSLTALTTLGALAALSMGSAWAQSGGASAMGESPAASAPGMSMGKAMGPGTDRRAARAGAAYTHGWGMMNSQERNEHREHMRSLKDYDECKAYMAQHHEQMAARAKERGGKTLLQPLRDACIGLKK